MPLIFSLLAGIMFGAGLTISDMVNPARVLNFVDLAGYWDPTLIFVMVGGLTVTTLGYRLVFRRGASLIGGKLDLPSNLRIDLPLISGAALFGIGWGLAGICPGPALADLATLEPKVLLFVAAMLGGMIVANTWRNRLRTTKALRPQT
jgi:uncharacterized protein